MRIRLDSIGCRLNIGEIEAIARSLAAKGHSIVSQGDPADLCILNTCTVTAIASKKSRAFIRQLRRRNPGARVIATGCLAELEPDSLETLGVDLVVGNDAKDDLPEILADRGWLTQDGAAPDPPAAIGARTRAFLKVQDGCDNRCTFCVVTIARGPGRSLGADEILAEIRKLVALGYLEVVLSGVHLGSYGHDLGRTRGLEHLVRAILAETDVPRLRLSSLEPWDLDAEFFRVFDDARVLPHLHLPLQSGCDATLARMARKTTVRGFADLLDSARSVSRDIAISTDVMVGFPGETDEEFASSIATVASFGFSRLHVFRYSRREGTRAAAMPGQVAGPVAADRSTRMHDLGERLASEYHHRFVGRRLDVLWEDAEEIGDQRRWSGLTGNYIRVLTETPAEIDLANTVTPVVLEACVPGAMIGSIRGVSSSPIEPTSRRQRASLPLRQS
jgi:threonylcarbamoyladenosine tRNA methylthiotransferase MtaB